MTPLIFFFPTADDRFKWIYKEKCAIERMCEDKQQVGRT